MPTLNTKFNGYGVTFQKWVSWFVLRKAREISLSKGEKVNQKNKLRSIFFNLVREIPLEVVFQKLGLKIEKRFSHISPLVVKIKCPFHSEKTPSLIVFNNGSWLCFGCGESGKGAFKFTLRYFEGNFNKTCRWFNKCFGIPLPWK